MIWKFNTFIFQVGVIETGSEPDFISLPASKLQIME